MLRRVHGVRCAKLLVCRKRGRPDQSSLIKSKDGSLISIVRTCLVVILIICRCICSSYFFKNDDESNLLIAMYIRALPFTKKTNYNPLKVWKLFSSDVGYSSLLELLSIVSKGLGNTPWLVSGISGWVYL